MMSIIPNQFSAEDIHFMELALQEASKAQKQGEVPVGAVIVDGAGKVLAKAGNKSITDNDPSGHAEMVALRKAGKKLGNYRLSGTTVYVTIEPCVMCAGTMVHARVARVVFGALDPKMGAMVSRYKIGTDGFLNHQMQLEGGLLADRCAGLLTSFFRKKRGEKFG